MASDVLNIDQVLAKALDKTVDVFEAVAKTLSAAAVEYGPQAVDAVLWVIRIDHIQLLALGLFWLIVILIFWWKWIKVLRANKFAAEDWLMIPTIVSFAITCGLCVGYVSNLFNVWNYVAIAKPEMWIAKQVVVKVEAMAKDVSKKK